MDSVSLTNTISKLEEQEAMSLSFACFKDAEDRQKDAITTECLEINNTILDTYTILSDAISGGMGSVWRVHNKNWDMDLAMKRPKPRYFAEGSRERKNAFIKECDNWIGLGLHPNIVSCYYVREIGGVPSVFSEWMDGGSLKDRIGDGTLYEGSPEEVEERLLDIAVQAARGLRYSHQKGLVHQDVKPGNILLTKDWEAKVADFGLASARSRSGDGQQPLFKGYTVQYCPPEQAAGREAESWMDVYAWAVTVIEMYAGGRSWSEGAEAFGFLFDRKSVSGIRFRVEPPKAFLDACREDFCRSGSSCRSIEAFERLLRAVYRNRYGREYPRPEAESVSDTAGSLNNKALSYLDLGMREAAEECWRRALEVDPMNLEACVNEGLCLWRNAQISDLEMAGRVWYFGPMYNYVLHDSSASLSYKEVRKAFMGEADEGMESFAPFGGTIRKYDRYVEGRGITRDARITGAALTGDRIVFYGREKDEDTSWAFYLGTGEAADGPADAGKQEEGREKPGQDGSTEEYEFRLKETDRPFLDCGMILQVLERPSGRIKRTAAVEHWGYEYDREGRERQVYPLLLTDYRNHRLVFVSRQNAAWAVYEMPVPSAAPQRMAFMVTRPVSSRERAEENTKRKEYAEMFRAAFEAEDFTKMNAVYDRSWELPLSKDADDRGRMNTELMKLCRLPGHYMPSPGTEVIIRGHDPADPLPAGLYGILPSGPGDRCLLPEQLPQEAVFHDDFDRTFFYMPWAETEGNSPDCVKAVVWERRTGSTEEFLIRPRLDGWYIHRVIAVSIQGNFLILELRPCRENAARMGREDTFTVTALTRNGRWMGEILQGAGNVSLQAVFLEDGHSAPHRGLLWLPGTRHLHFFELDNWEMYMDWEIEDWRYRSYAFPLPEEVFPIGKERRLFYPVKGPAQTIESIMISADGESFAMVVLEEDKKCRTLYLKKESDKSFRCYPFDDAERILLTRDHRYILAGKSMERNHSHWSWSLYPAVMQRKQRRLWELREFSQNSRIAGFSYDLCRLLDARGFPVYEVCWRYENGEKGAAALHGNQT